MNKAWTEASSFEIFPEEPLMTFNKEMELQGNSAEGHVLEEAMRGFGRYSANNRDHTAYEIGGDPMGSEVPALYPTLKGNEYGDTDPAGEEDSPNDKYNKNESAD